MNTKLPKGEYDFIEVSDAFRKRIKDERALAKVIEEYVPLRDQLRHRINRLGRKLGISRKRICDEAYISYTSLNNYLRDAKMMSTDLYDRVALVCCHYEYMADLADSIEQVRWKRVSKSYKRDKRLPD